MGTAPIIGYHYGALNHNELKGLLKKSCVIIGSFAVFMFVLAEALANPLSKIFVGYDEALMDLTLHGFRIYSFSFLLSGFAIYGSSFFTALNDGLISALISFLRTVVFQVAAVLLLPIFFKVDGIWISLVAAEVVAVGVTIIFIIAKRKKYKYF